MAGVKGTKRLSEAEFNKIKKLQDAGLSVGVTVKVTGRSWSSVHGVYNASSLKEYRSKNAAARRRYPSTNKAEANTDNVRPAEDMELVISKLNNLESCMNELLQIFRDKEAKANVAFWKR